MKKTINILLSSLAVLVLASCGANAVEKDANGHSPKDVVDEMYKAIQQEDFDAVVALCNVPDTVVVKKMDGSKDTITDNPARVAQSMKDNSKSMKIVEWELKEEGDKTDPNLATVKAKVTFEKEGAKSTVDAAFPMKRGRDNVWKVNG